MKKAVSFVLFALAGVCCVVAAYFCQFYYSSHHNDATKLESMESRMNYFDVRLAELEAHKSRELTPVHIWGRISTSDQLVNEHMLGYLSLDKHHEGFFEAVNAKGGAFIRPEIRLPVNSATNSEFDIQIDSQFGNVADVWLSHAEPYQDLASFEQFKIYCPHKTNMVRLIARAKPGASIEMRFDMVVLCQQ
jgi:hypothetical protein